MRIPRHHNQAPVAYLHQTNNNDIVSRNTLPDTIQTTATLNSTTSPLSTSSLTSSISTTTTAAITENSTITNYTPHFDDFNENGNGNGNGNDNTIESTGKRTISQNTGRLIDRDDNVNLMLSPVTKTITNPQNLNHNQTRKYSRNQNYSRYQDHQLLNQNCQNINRIQRKDCNVDTKSEVEVRYNNLNQLNSRECGYDTKTEATRIEDLIGNNGNINEFNDGSRITTSSLEVFEGNLNVLVAEEDNTQIIHQTIAPASFESEKLSRRNFASRFTTSETTKDRATVVSEDEVEENLNTPVNKNLFEYKEKIENVTTIEPNSNDNDGDEDDVEFREIESEEEICSNSTEDCKVNIVNIQSELLESSNIQACHSSDIENPEDPQTEAVELVSSETNTNDPEETTGASDTENRNLNSNQNQFNDQNSKSDILSTESARRNLAKLDLDKSLDELHCKAKSGGDSAVKDHHFLPYFDAKDSQQEEEEHQHRIHSEECHQNLSIHRHRSCRHHHRNSYRRHQDNSVSSNSTESSPDDSLMDDDDGFSLTPSSCASLDSPELGHYPRGIINPNYPGFQHLAHTLSEHFVNHHLDQDDSDLSEFEVELSVESLDDSFASYHPNNEMTESPVQSNSSDKEPLQKVEEDLETGSSSSLKLYDQTNYNMSPDTSAGSEKDLILPDIEIADDETIYENTAKESLTKSNCTKIKEMANTETILSIYSEELSCDLDTYLKKFETNSDIKTLQSPSLIEDATRNCPTPDILIKNDKKSCRKKNSPTLSTENRPDLLRNVSPNSDCYSSEEKKPRISVPDNIPIEAKNDDRPECKDDFASYSVTPVDIIGDFGREVEHEFGLIVSGYNSSLIGRSSMCTEEMITKAMSNAYDKMTDAALSECKEAISVCSDRSLSGKSLMHGASTYDSTTCDLVQTTTPSASLQRDETLECPFENVVGVSCKQSEFQHFSSSSHSPSSSERSAMQNSSDDQITQSPSSSLSSVNENSNENNISNGPTSTESARSAESESNAEAGTIRASDQESSSFPGTSDNHTEKLIPTAIVKPKYQKPSYDERQLPPIGLAYCVVDQSSPRAWFEQKSSKDTTHPPSGAVNSAQSSVGDSTRVRKIQHFAGQSDNHRERGVKYSKKSIGRASSSAVNSRSEKLTHNGSVRKDLSSSSRSAGSSCIAIVTPRKKDKMENYTSFSGGISGEKRVLCNSVDRNVVFEKNNNNNNNLLKSKKMSINNNRKERSANAAASFDVYNIETALPVIDLEAIENHLKKAKEEERKRRNDREEIRRRLAMGAEDDYFSKMVNQDRPGRKPSLQSRLQSGMNLQICFMNEASSDTESPSSDSETCPKLSKSISNSSNMSRYSNLSTASSAAQNPYNSRPLSVNILNTNNINSTITNANNNNNNITSMFTNKTNPNNNSHNIVFNNKKFNNQINRPSTLSLGPPISDEDAEADFFTKQARLQIEARMALAQAKDMAHMQMEIERQKQKISPITEVIRNSMEKVGVPFPPEKRRVSRQMLTDMNIAQLQIIVNDLHSQIERLNEQLVQYLMERDDLHMGQDSMLVDIEDLTRYLGAKEQSKLNGKSSSVSPSSNDIPNDFTNQNNSSNNSTNNLNNSTPTQNGSVQSQNKFLRIANLVKK